MDHSLSLHISLPSTPIFNSNRSDFALGFLAGFSFWKPPLTARPRSLAVLASAGSSHCEFGSFNTPLNPRSSVGKHLTRVLQNYRQLFHVSVQDELKRLADRRDAAVDRMLLAAGSDEALLHRFVFSSLSDSESDGLRMIRFRCMAFFFFSFFGRADSLKQFLKYLTSFSLFFFFPSL